MFKLYRYPEPTGGDLPANPANPANPAAPTTPDPSGKTGEPSGAQGKTFTQEQLDAILTDRLARKDAQFKDYADLKKFKDEQESKNKTELEKANDARVKAENEAKRIKDDSTQRLLISEARAVAAELGFTKPDKAVKLADLSKAVKDGEIDSEAVKVALDALVKEMPELLSKKTPTVTATNPTKGSAEAGKETDEQKRARLRGGSAFDVWSKSGEVVINNKTVT